MTSPRIDHPTHRRGQRPGQPLLHLPVDEWPVEDRDLFARAFFKPNDFFSDVGSGYPLKPSTKDAVRYGYRRWLGWLAAHHVDLLAEPPVERITIARVRDYVGHLRNTCRERAIATQIRYLYDAFRFMYPSVDWSWLKTLKTRLERAIPRQGRAPILITSRELIDTSLKRLDAVDLDFDSSPADGTHKQLQALALRYRDGLLVAVATFFPLRRSNLADLMIGSTLRRGESGWSINIPGERVKNGEALDADLPTWISERIARFVEIYRPLIYLSESHKGLWASAKGQPATGGALFKAFQKEVTTSLGFNLKLHDTRRISATTWAIHDPANVAGAKDLLGDRSDRVFACHYNLASGIDASRLLAQINHRLKRQNSRRQPTGDKLVSLCDVPTAAKALNATEGSQPAGNRIRQN